MSYYQFMIFFERVCESRSFLYIYTVLAALAAPFFAFAQFPNPSPVNLLLTNVLVLLEVVVQILITLAILVFGWGVVKLIMSAGSPEQAKKAKAILFSGIIGIFVLASLYGIITFIKTYVGIPNNPVIQAPKFK